MQRLVEQQAFLQQRKLSSASFRKLCRTSPILRALKHQTFAGRSNLHKQGRAPLAIADRLVRALRWTKHRGLSCLLLGFFLCAPMARAQLATLDMQPQLGEINGAVLLDGLNRPMDGVAVNVRSLPGGSFASVLADSSGRFQLRSLASGTYEVSVQEAGYEPTRITLHLHGPSPPLELHLKPSSDSHTKSAGGYTVSLRQLRIPAKALRAFRRGLERLAKLDAVGGRKQFAQAIAAFPGYYEAYYHKGVSELRLGHNDEAAEAFQKAIDLSEGRYAWAQFGLGAILCRRGQYKEGEAIIRKGLDLDGTSDTGHLFLSTALFGQNRLVEAEQSAREALLSKPGLALAYLVLADIHGRKGKYALEVHDLDAYLKLAPKEPASKQVRDVRELVQQIASRSKS
jgi:tetratricopeptide (TPR) repeat protein